GPPASGRGSRVVGCGTIPPVRRLLFSHAIYQPGGRETPGSGRCGGRRRHGGHCLEDGLAAIPVTTPPLTWPSRGPRPPGRGQVDGGSPRYGAAGEPDGWASDGGGR